MRIMRIIAFAMIAFFSCCSKTRTNESAPGDIAYQTIAEFSKEMKENGFYLSMCGGRFGDEIGKFNLGFHTKKKVDLQEARKTMIYSVSRFLKSVNDNEKINSFLKERPFSEKNLTFHIHFVDEDKSEYIDGSISAVHVIHVDYKETTIVHYDIYDPAKDDWVECYRETYEEAERIVRAGG